MESNIWPHCAPTPHSCISRLTALDTIDYMAIVCAFAETLKAAFSEGALVLSWEPNLDYHSKSMADFSPPAVPMKKSSLISAAITERLADIWTCEGGGRDSHALMS